MTEKENQRIKELKQLILKYDKQYYEQNISEISDAEYDRLYAEYEALEKKYPELSKLPDSPTKRVGAGAIAGTLTGLPKYTHKSPLLSIDRKAKDISALKEFYDKVGGDGTQVIIEPKLDGITCNINYENGCFINAATRGNGYIGDLVTENFKMTETLYPEKLSQGSSLEIRGEAIIPYDFFIGNLSEEFSNPRNAVAGIMRQLDAGKVRNKGIKVMFYDIGETTLPIVDSDKTNVHMLSKLGFETVPAIVVNCWDSLKNCVETGMDGYIKEVDGFHVLMDEDNRYPKAVCDGIVIKVNSRKKRDEIGMSEKGPKWAFAYKFKPLQAETRIDHIEWQVGKTGRIVPVAVFDEISLGGTNITRATLNNYEYMKKLPVLSKDRVIKILTPYDTWLQSVNIEFKKPLKSMDYIRINDVLYDTLQDGQQSYIIVTKKENNGFWGRDEKEENWYLFAENRYCLLPMIYDGSDNFRKDEGIKMDDIIIVERANDVIPRIVAIKKRGSDAWNELTVNNRMKSFISPTSCPVCGEPVYTENQLHYCSNPLCPAQLKAKLVHFASRDAMNIIGLGEGIIDILFDTGILTDIPSVFSLPLHKEKLEQLPKFGKRKVEKLLKSIEDAKHPELWQFIYALSIPGVGQKASKDLAGYYHTLKAFMEAKPEDLILIEDMGEITVQAIIDFISAPQCKDLIYHLLESGVDPKPIKSSSNRFVGMSFVITGTFLKPRKFYQEIIEANGGKLSNSVSKKTAVVMIGEDAGSKEQKARDLVNAGYPLILLEDEDEIMKFLEG